MAHMFPSNTGRPRFQTISGLAANTIGQEAYSLVNIRVGVTRRALLGEVFVRNAFDTRYIPLAFPYPSFARRASWGRWALHAPRA
jgi:hypothetical protein